MTTIALTLLGFAACTTFVIVACRRAPIIEDDGTSERIERIIGIARHHRQQLEAAEAELLEIHRYARGTCEADDLMDVIWGGVSYVEAMQRIRRREDWKEGAA